MGKHSKAKVACARHTLETAEPSKYGKKQENRDSEKERNKKEDKRTHKKGKIKAIALAWAQHMCMM